MGFDINTHIYSNQTDNISLFINKVQLQTETQWGGDNECQQIQ